MCEQNAAAEILAWYDTHARALPWRVPPARSVRGTRPDPYHIWLSEVMLQQTTVPAVIPYFQRFTETWPTVAALAAAEDEAILAAWAGLGYYARARNLIRAARAVAAAGAFPETEDGLRTLPGIGAYTAAAIAAIAFGRRAVVVDGNVERVMARLGDIRAPLPGSKPALRAAAERLTPDNRPGDYAQAVMDLGATICTPKRPACGICPWMHRCAARAAGSAPDLPAKAPKTPKPVRHGTVYVLRRADGAVLLERRPENGLLGGMVGLPGNVWAEDPPPPSPPAEASWRDAGEVRHTFTHFHLVLKVAAAEGSAASRPVTGAFRLPEGLPTVFRKALKAGLSALEARG